LTETSPALLQAFYDDLNATGGWPTHLAGFRVPSTAVPADYIRALREYLLWKKGVEGASWLMAMATLPADLPATITDALRTIKSVVETPPPAP
jgi:hypothetical protein